MVAFSGFIKRARCFTPTATQWAVFDKQKSYFHVDIGNSLGLWHGAQIFIHLSSTPVVVTYIYIYIYIYVCVKSSFILEHEAPVMELADTAVFIVYIILTFFHVS